MTQARDLEKLNLSLKGRSDSSYQIVIGKGLFPLIAVWIAGRRFGKIALLTDSNVRKLHANRLISTLKKKGLRAEILSFPAGEASKDRKTKEKLEDELTSRRFGRDSLIIALGGGVAGDLAGFVASTYMRGIPFIQVPTTLLAMVDSSIGGKTGVNTPFGKNLIGTFYQPKAVFIDIAALDTLPKQEMLNGIVEMVKHGIIADKDFFEFMRDNLEGIYNLEENILITAIKKSCEIKKKVVESDEKERGIRKTLNLGHTIGHAVEKASGYKLSHGIAVGMGIIAETKLALFLKLIRPEECLKIIDLIKRLGISTKFLKTNAASIVKNTFFDKKNTAQKPNYVLPVKIGKTAVDIRANEKAVAKVLKV